MRCVTSDGLPSGAALGHDHGRFAMAMVRDLLYQLAGSAMAEQEIADELRTDVSTVQKCLQRLAAASVVQGPEGAQRMWTAVPEDAPFDVMVTKAKGGGIEMRQSLAEFAAS
jgi:hypothetical protein